MMCFCNLFWLPKVDSTDGLPMKLKEIYINETYSGKYISYTGTYHLFD